MVLLSLIMLPYKFKTPIRRIGRCLYLVLVRSSAFNLVWHEVIARPKGEPRGSAFPRTRQLQRALKLSGVHRIDSISIRGWLINPRQVEIDPDRHQRPREGEIAQASGFKTVSFDSRKQGVMGRNGEFRPWHLSSVYDCHI